MPEVRNPGVGAGQQALLVSTVLLTAAQIRTGRTAPPIVVAAPGAGKILYPMFAAFVYLVGTTPFEPASLDTADLAFGGTLIPSGITLGTPFFSAPVNGFAFNVSFSPATPPPQSEYVNQPLVFHLPGDLTQGSIATATLGAGGAGYAPNDTGTITTTSGDATYKVLTVGGGGAVLTFQITGAGTSYATGNGQATAVGGAQPGVGAGLTVNITAVNAGDGTLKVVTFYQIIPVP